MKELVRNLKFTWQYLKEYKWKLIGYTMFNIFGIGCSIVMPIVSAQVIISLTNNQFQQILYMATILLVLNLVMYVIRYVTSYFSQFIYRECFIKMQMDLGKEIVKIENQCIDKNSSGVFIQRLTNDTSLMADIVNVLNLYISNIVLDIGIFIAIFILHKGVFLYMVVMVLLLFIIDKKKVTKYNEKDRVYRQKHEQAMGFVGELVRGVRDIKMLNAEDSFIEALETKVKDLHMKKYEMGIISRNYRLLHGTLHTVFDTGLIFFLVYLIAYHHFAAASALVLYNYRNQVTSLVDFVGILMDSIKDFNLSSSRVFSIFTSKEFAKEKFGQKHLPTIKGDFSFEDVSFAYEKNESVLNHVNFTVHANETVAFVGKSGAGKSTIFHLLCKMYEIDSGKITIDGVDIRELDKDTIRGNISIISQNPYIFHLSIRDNLKLVKRDLTEEEMVEACQLACLHDFIMSLPHQYDTIVGEGGINLSGGQRQRLAIARAFVQKTEIILFDEATSALDNETQASIQKAIENLQKDYTILIIAHRLSTVIHSNRIIFLEKGQIVAEGTHQELLETCPAYQHLYESELQK